jgi:hypothetical protein
MGLINFINKTDKDVAMYINSSWVIVAPHESIKASSGWANYLLNKGLVESPVMYKVFKKQADAEKD